VIVTLVVTDMADHWGESQGHSSEPGVTEGFEDDFVPLSSSRSQIPSQSLTTINFIPRLHEADKADSKNPLSQPLPPLKPLKDPLTQMMTSEEYISRLETKLKRIKGTHKDSDRKKLSLSARHMIDALSSVRESITHHHLIGTPVDSVIPVPESSMVQISPSALMQRVFPERTPLTQEELEWLVNHDHLQPGDEAELQPEGREEIS